MLNSCRGMFIALEGIDGAGKTVAAEASGKLMQELDYQVITLCKQYPPVENPYISGHLTQLRKIIWEHAPDDPYYLLGQDHWIHLVASWFSAVSHCVISPMLERGENVLVDNWISKSLARMRLNPTVEYSYVEPFFAKLPVPDLVILLDLDPSIAATRKAIITAIEAGKSASDGAINLENYVAYQTTLREELRSIAHNENWFIIEAGDLSLQEISKVIVTVVAAAFDRRSNRLMQR